MIIYGILLLFAVHLKPISADVPFRPQDIQQVPTDVILRECLKKNGLLPPHCVEAQGVVPGVALPNGIQFQPQVQQTQQFQQQGQAPPVPMVQPMYAPPPLPNPQAGPNLCNAKLSTILKENTGVRNQLVQFLEYSGVPPPWDQLLDFETTQHHQLPDPDNMFRKIRNLLLKFDGVKNCIVEALLVIEKYIGRGKAYIIEDLKDLKRYRTILRGILAKLCTNPSAEVKNELFKRFYHIKSKAKDVETSFCKLRDWIIKITKLFKTL